MEYEKFIDKDGRGTYCLVFQNRDSLSVDEIKDIFSNFGEIFSVKSVGDERGYRFIRYKTYREAFDAIEGLKNHPKIKFAEHRKKQEKSNSNFNDYNSTNKNQFQNGYCNKSSTQERITKNRMFAPEAEMFKDNTRGSKESLNASENFDNNSIKSNSNNTKRKNSYDKRELKSQYFKNNDQNQPKSRIHTPESEMFEDASSINQSLNGPPSIEKNSNIKTKSLSSLPDVAVRSELNINKSYSLKSEEVNEKVPDLISTTGRTIQNQKRIVLNAEEVIVGNIHPKFGSPYILHLLDRFEPIAISMINVLQESDIRYCSVYFKSLEDALQVENQFDQMDLSGKKLVVLRPCQLIEEAAY